MEKLITVEMFFFKGAPDILCECVCLEKKKRSIFLFVSIKRHVNEDTVSTCGLLSLSTAL